MISVGGIGPVRFVRQGLQPVGVGTGGVHGGDDGLAVIHGLAGPVLGLLWDVTPAAKKWYDGGSNYGLVMTSNADSSSKYRTWFSYNSKVYFVASYRSTNGIEDYYTYQTMGAP